MVEGGSQDGYLGDGWCVPPEASGCFSTPRTYHGCGIRLRSTVVLWMMGTAQHPYDQNANDYTATSDLAFELDSGGSLNGGDATDRRGTVVSEAKNKQHMVEVRVMLGKINRFKVRSVSRREARLVFELS